MPQFFTKPQKPLRASTPEEKDAYEKASRLKEEEYRKQHPWISAAEDFTTNLLGLKSTLDEDGRHTYPALAGELAANLNPYNAALTAGRMTNLPPWAMGLLSAGALGATVFPKGKTIYHATKVPTKFEQFDPARNSGDWLSNAVHFGEDPELSVNVANEIKLAALKEKKG
jgi:hypothetical protein